MWEEPLCCQGTSPFLTFWCVDMTSGIYLTLARQDSIEGVFVSPLLQEGSLPETSRRCLIRLFQPAGKPTTYSQEMLSQSIPVELGSGFSPGMRKRDLTAKRPKTSLLKVIFMTWSSEKRHLMNVSFVVLLVF